MTKRRSIATQRHIDDPTDLYLFTWLLDLCGISHGDPHVGMRGHWWVTDYPYFEAKFGEQGHPMLLCDVFREGDNGEWDDCVYSFRRDDPATW